ncbi:glycosyltransferase family 2 protein [Flavobacterium sandaracinum]|uniref:Glycosyltransferase family 2 protein n=1 Tax=Flavobacterium sandaracinum TaxID=2541733 RepID=A0A4V2Z0R2_9FLAO|nr:glycosyltransferase family 2 protein [Flavobacterium sandaracinum]TDE02048.1 glycosyltransferase family 2 protein [Flavobacterium sandaracinum]
MTYPTVTIIMATYNRANFIVESLLSIQKQTFLDWECLIIDDGGTDNTKEVVESFIEKDNRFKFYLRTNDYLKGLPGSRNYGLDIAKGDFIIFFDDDDIPHPQNLQICVSELSNNNDIYFCRYVRNVFFEGFHYDFDLSKDYTHFYINDKDILQMLNNELQFNSCAVMWKKICFKKHRFVETLMYAEEWELYSRIVSAGYHGISIDKCLFYGRKHLRSNTGEFYSNNPIRRASYVDAIILVVQNLKQKQLLTYSLKRYFIATAIDYEEYNLFDGILYVLDLPKFEKVKWRVFYAILPFRLKIHWLKKVVKNKIGNLELKK